MKSTLTLAAAVTAAFALSACNQAAPPAAPAADTAAITQEITQLEARWSAVAAAKDAAGFAAFYTDDASIFLSGVPPLHGRAAAQAALTQAMADPNFAVSFATRAVQVASSGDFACSEGGYTETATNPTTHQPVTEHGNYVTCWRRQAGGTWLAVQDISTAEPPAAPAAPAT